jgi:hypothetical protein
MKRIGNIHVPGDNPAGELFFSKNQYLICFKN